jgi:hypothetical protein
MRLKTAHRRKRARLVREAQIDWVLSAMKRRPYLAALQILDDKLRDANGNRFVWEAVVGSYRSAATKIIMGLCERIVAIRAQTTEEIGDVLDAEVIG